MGFQKEGIAATVLIVFVLLQFAHANNVLGSSSKLRKNEAPNSKILDGQSNLVILRTPESKLEEEVETESTGNPITLPAAAQHPTQTSLSNGKSKNKAWAESPMISEPIPIRFRKDREFVSYVPSKTNTKKSIKSGSSLRSRRSYYLPGLDLSRLIENENTINEEKDEFASKMERERLLQLLELLTKDSNPNGLSDADFDDEDEVIDLMHYDPYSFNPKQKQRNSKRRISNGELGSDEIISLMSSHPENANRSPARRSQRLVNPHSSHLMKTSNGNTYDVNDGEWFEEAIPIQRHSMKRSGNFRSHAPTILQRGLIAIPIGSEERNAKNQAFFESLRQFPITRQTETTMNSRALKSGDDDGLYSLNQLLSDSQGVDPRVPVYQRAIL